MDLIDNTKESWIRRGVVAGAIAGTVLSAGSFFIKPSYESQKHYQEYQNLRETKEIIEGAINHYPLLPTGDSLINSNYTHGISRSNERENSLYTALERTNELVDRIENSSELREHKNKQEKRSLLFKSGFFLMSAAGMAGLGKTFLKKYEKNIFPKKDIIESQTNGPILKIINGGRQ